ncbi:MAG: GNAT family N-acetyltransferase [Pseudomonadota bacterium]
MKILILHDYIPPEAPPDLRDSLIQVQQTVQALSELGHSASCLAFNSDLDLTAREISAAAPDLVFNLVESVGGEGRYIHLAPELLEKMALPFCGAGAWAMKHTSNKLLAKEALRRLGLPTPAWLPGPGLGEGAARYIVKSVWEHSSVGLDEDSVSPWTGPAEAGARLVRRAPFLGGECFAEEYIAGREFNLAVLAGPDGPEVLPPAEIIFQGYAPDSIKVVGYKAKWNEDAPEYWNTPRRFLHPPGDRELLETLTSLSLACWNGFGLRGWARVDFRVDQAGQPFILEINANPCLSADAGFMAAAAQAGLTPRNVFGRILADVPAREKKEPHGRPGNETAPAWRHEAYPGDRETVRRLCRTSEMFSPAEVDIAEELVREHLDKGAAASGYFFLFAQDGPRVVGYACFGPIAGSLCSWDLYWIVVDKQVQGRGLGRKILNEVEKIILGAGRGRIYVETSSRPDYRLTRKFYEGAGYFQEAVIQRFYGPDDHKVIYVKAVGPEPIA